MGTGAPGTLPGLATASLPLTDAMRTFLTTALMIFLGGIGGVIAKKIGMPLPYMLGALLTTSVLSVLVPRIFPEGYQTPNWVRSVFIAVIGLAIGSKVTLEVLWELRNAVPSFIALILFVPLALWTNYLIFRRIGGYDPATAYFSGTPGGLVEAMLMGEQAGAQDHIVTMQQFLRIIFVVTMLPVGLSIYYGHPVGSSAGMTLGRDNAGLEHLPEILVLGAIGIFLGRLQLIPAGQLVGPLAVGAIATITGLAVLDMPGWMLSVAQVVIGALLGTRFNGIKAGMIVKGAWLSFLSVSSMLILGGIFAALVRPLTGEPFDVLLVSLTPGGVTEMALIALSLQANPAFVTMHHIFRILLTVMAMSWAYKRYLAPRK